MKRNEDSLRDFWENIKHINIHFTADTQGGERGQGPENIFKDIIAENFPNLGKETVTEFQEVQRFPYRITPKRNTQSHIIITDKNLKRIFKAEKEKQQITNKPTPIRLSPEFSAETTSQKGVARCI